MAKVGILQTKGMDKGNSTVWIGFMDIVPVIGAVKESVEFVLALYEGNSEEIKKKEKALDNIVKQLTQSEYKPAADAADADTTKCYNVTEVQRGRITEYVQKGSKNLNLSQKEARKRKVCEIQKDMKEKLRQSGQPLLDVLTEHLKRSKRGEHVFNNNILKFHSKVLRDFIEKYNIQLLRGYKLIQQTLNKLGEHTLSLQTAEDIQTNMVAHFDSDEVYVNVNAIPYGEFCKALREALLNVLDFQIPSEETAKNKESVTHIIENMNKLQIYVDQYAKEKWRNNNRARNKRFKHVRGKVAHMYSTDRGLNWCTHIKDVVVPLFDSK